MFVVWGVRLSQSVRWLAVVLQRAVGALYDLTCSLVHSSRSFMPPSRDEESETQRKAHAKMVRSTRRSTQGVTLEDLKSAEQLMKNKQQQLLQQQATVSIICLDKLLLRTNL